MWIYLFFLKVFGGHMSFFWGHWYPCFWISGDVSSGFQSQSGLPYSHCGGECNVRSLRSTSGATLANLLAAGVQPVLSPHTVAEVRLPGFELVLSEYLWARRSINWAKPGPYFARNLAFKRLVGIASEVHIRGCTLVVLILVLLPLYFHKM